MKTPRKASAERVWSLASIVIAGALVSAAAIAATTQYQYDALGRLRRVIHDTGTITDYTYDAAGNRTSVGEAPPVAPSIPSSISVGTSSSTGTFWPSWGTASGTVTRYELFESTSSAFPTQSLVYSGLSLTVQITRPNGTYYYRVRACNNISCSDYRVGANGMVVFIPPPAPPPPTGLNYMLIQTCTWRASWNAVSGAANYRFRDTAGNERTVTATTTNVTCPPSTNRPKWVKACNSTGNCSAQANF